MRARGTLVGRRLTRGAGRRVLRSYECVNPVCSGAFAALPHATHRALLASALEAAEKAEEEANVQAAACKALGNLAGLPFLAQDGATFGAPLPPQSTSQRHRFDPCEP